LRTGVAQRWRWGYVGSEQEFVHPTEEVASVSSIISELEDLEHHLDLANKGSLVGSSAEEMAAAMALVGRMRNKFDALDAGTVRAFEARAGYRDEGHASSVGWRKHHGREKGPAAHRSRRLAGWLSGLPLAHEALLEGSITADHVQVLARAQGLLGEETFVDLEEHLVKVARRDRFCDFERTVEYWLVRAAPADAAERERRAHDERHASSTAGPGGQGGRVKARFAQGFSTWQAELDRLSDHLLEEDRAEARDRLGRAPVASELGRTAGQRRLDAMDLMAKRSAAFGDADLGAAPMCLNVFADLTTLEKVIERLLEALGGQARADLDDLEYDGDSLHELEDGTVVTVNTILLALLTGTIRGILFDPAGEVLRYGRERRLFSPAQARLLRALFRRCGHPYGCDHAGRRLESDHRVEWEDGGLTDVTNGDCRCRSHKQQQERAAAGGSRRGLATNPARRRASSANPMTRSPRTAGR